MTLDKEKVRAALKSYDDGWTPWHDERGVIYAAARAWLDGQERVMTTKDDIEAVRVALEEIRKTPYRWVQDDDPFSEKWTAGRTETLSDKALEALSRIEAALLEGEDVDVPSLKAEIVNETCDDHDLKHPFVQGIFAAVEYLHTTGHLAGEKDDIGELLEEMPLHYGVHLSRLDDECTFAVYSSKDKNYRLYKGKTPAEAIKAALKEVENDS